MAKSTVFSCILLIINRLNSNLFSLEKKNLQEAGGTFAILMHLDDNKKKQFVVEILSLERIKSVEIEGEILQCESLQSSIQRHFCLKADDKKMLPKEKGMADLLYQMYATYDQPLNHKMLFEWHRLLMQNNPTAIDKGKYRSHEDPMQIVSGQYDKATVYFEAPPRLKYTKK